MNLPIPIYKWFHNAKYSIMLTLHLKVNYIQVDST